MYWRMYAVIATIIGGTIAIDNSVTSVVTAYIAGLIMGGISVLAILYGG